MNQETSAAKIVEQTKEWLEKAVIGLNLCPFAKPVYTQNLIRYVVSSAKTEDELEMVLQAELQLLTQTPITEIETTLLIHPELLHDFLDYNDFLGVAQEALEEMELDGVIQIASFHPQFQFAGTEVEDIGNYTNRSPYPMLHLLREDSVTRAVESSVDVGGIPEKNTQTLERLGHKGWQKLKIPTGAGGSNLH